MAAKTKRGKGREDFSLEHILYNDVIQAYKNHSLWGRKKYMWRNTAMSNKF